MTAPTSPSSALAVDLHLCERCSSIYPRRETAVAINPRSLTAHRTAGSTTRTWCGLPLAGLTRLKVRPVLEAVR